VVTALLAVVLTGPAAVAETARSLPAFVRATRAAGDADGYVVTPGGRVHRSCVFGIPTGARVADGRVTAPDGQAFELPTCSYPPRPAAGRSEVERRGRVAAPVPALDGWVASVGATSVDLGQGQRWFTAQSGHLIVPPLPASGASGQTLFLFHSLSQSAAIGTGILQPVLQFGASAAGDASETWMLGSWFVDAPRGVTLYSLLIPASPGDDFFGKMESTVCGPVGCQSSCDASGSCYWKITSRNNTTSQEVVLYTVQGPFDRAEKGVLEVYGVHVCDQLPAEFGVFTSVFTAQLSSRSPFGELVTDKLKWNNWAAGGTPRCTLTATSPISPMANLRLGGDGFIASPPELAAARPVPATGRVGLALLGLLLSLMALVTVRKRASLTALLVLLSVPPALVGCDDGPGALVDLPGTAASPAQLVSDAAVEEEPVPPAPAAAAATGACPLPDPTGGGCVAAHDHSQGCHADGVCRPLCAASDYEVLCRASASGQAPPPPSAELGCTAVRIPTGASWLLYCCPCR
jgi:hypothetical protein